MVGNKIAKIKKHDKKYNLGDEIISKEIITTPDPKFKIEDYVSVTKTVTKKYALYSSKRITDNTLF